jgi:hypothetical protein
VIQIAFDFELNDSENSSVLDLAIHSIDLQNSIFTKVFPLSEKASLPFSFLILQFVSLANALLQAMSNYNMDTVELRAFLDLPRFFILPTS